MKMMPHPTTELWILEALTSQEKRKSQRLRSYTTTVVDQVRRREQLDEENKPREDYLLGDDEDLDVDNFPQDHIEHYEKEVRGDITIPSVLSKRHHHSELESTDKKMKLSRMEYHNQPDKSINVKPTNEQKKSIRQPLTISIPSDPVLMCDNEDVDEEDMSINQVGVVLFKGHQSYHLMRNVQMGIRYVVGGVHSKPRVTCLMESDFKKKVKLDFPSKGSDKTPAHTFSDFQFKDYAPNVFRSLREIAGIDAGDYMLSLCGNDSLSMLGTPGKSGALFFFSQNMKYIIKTVTKKEASFLKQLLIKYHEHLATYPDTLLTKFFGLHRIKPSGGRIVRFIVMNNVFTTHLKIHERYDLKGSTVDRAATEEEKKRKNPILKDLDISFPVYLGKEKKEKVITQIRDDCNFLQSNNIMDYSMLLGVHNSQRVDEDSTEPSDMVSLTTQDNGSLSTVSSNDRSSRGRLYSFSSTVSTPTLASSATSLLSTRSKIWREKRSRKCKIDCLNTFQQDFGGALSTDPDPGKVYFFGIIDILQKWNTRKQVEQFLKSFKYEKTDLSVAHPQQYAKRFMTFMDNLFRYDECNCGSSPNSQ